MKATVEWKNPHGTDAPTPIRSESGCKVGWNFYATQEEAKACAAWAEAEGRYKASLGYDFGYCTPGSIARQADGTYKVTIP